MQREIVPDVDHDGQLDLLVGNEFGDVLVLPGNGDGTFGPYQRTDANIALAVADLNGDGQEDFIFANQAQDRVVVDYSGSSTTVLGDRADGLLAPGAVQLADLNGDGTPDLIVANSGGNNVLVYPGLANGQFGPAVNGGHGFFAGTNPEGITVSDVNGDGTQDLVVANRGSNDVSVLLGEGQGADWTLTPGPRLQAGYGPVATAIQDVTGDGIPDIVVTDSQSNDVRVLPGIGSDQGTGAPVRGTGFFRDRNPIIIPLPPRSNPGPVFIDPSSKEIVTVNPGSNDVTVISDFLGGSPVTRSFPSGGLNPVAAFAGDFNHDGRLDLVVGNFDDGHLSLLLGGADGLDLVSTLTQPDLPHPTSLFFSTIKDGELEFFATTAGRERAFPLGFDLPGEAREGEGLALPPVSMILPGSSD